MWLVNTAKASIHILMILLKYTYKRPPKKGSYYILLETIENFKYIGTLLVEKKLSRNEVMSAHDKKSGKLRQLLRSFRIRETS